METVTLYQTSDWETKLTERIIGKDRKLVSSIQFQLENPLISSKMAILNDPDKVENARISEKREEVWRIHGIPMTNGSLLREYIVCVFQTRVLVMYRSLEQTVWITPKKKRQKQSYQRVSLTDKGKEVRQIKTLAIRALYALGLDYGIVICGIAPGKKMVVSNVVLSPKLNKEMETLLVREIRNYYQKMQQLTNELSGITLGADAEFVMLTPKGNLLIASKYFPIQGKVGCDAAWIGNNRANKPLVEVRPEPTSDPRQLVARIYQCLLQASKRMKNVSCRWLAGNLPYAGFPIGGHIHFSGITPNFKLLRAFDNYLALLLVGVEDERGKNRRPKYGFLGDFRFQEHGGFEYRTLPSWLVSPTLTKGVLAAAKLIAANYWRLPCNALDEVSLQKAYYEGKKELIRERIEPLWEELKHLPQYTVYEKYLNDFYRYLTSGKTWDESHDFRRLWRIPPFHVKK